MPWKPPVKKELRKFHEYVEGVLSENNASLIDSVVFANERAIRTSKRWTVVTVGGAADVSFHGDSFDLYIRFHDVERARNVGRFNEHGKAFNGKWNHHTLSREFSQVQTHVGYVLSELFEKETK